METKKRLIDLDAYEDFKTECLMSITPGLHSFDAGFEEGMERAAEWLDAQTTVDAVEVVHAEWIDIRFDPMWRSMLATCSHCKVRGEVRVKSNECGFAVPDSNHCPNCGAKMDGDGNG